MKRLLVAATIATALCAGASPAGAVQLQPVAQNLSEPVHVTGAPGDDTRLYVVEKAGRVKVVRDGAVQAQLFLDVSGSVSAAGEGGLLSMAFPPDHRATGTFYVLYTAPAASGGDIVVAERRLSACSPDVADPAYEREVIRIPHPTFTNHYGGQLQWGPDGNLWISTGDGGGGYDPFDNAQNKDSLLGKLLRITPTPGGGYAVPAGNPFVGAAGADEVWAYGLRNPWRFSFDRSTGDVWIGDVGQGGVRPGDPTNTNHQNIEEVDVARAAAGRLPGANFGWDRFEGNRDFVGGAAPLDYVAPVITHLRGGTPTWAAVTGGYVVRDPALEWLGEYVYSDLAHGQIWRDEAAAPGTPIGTGLAIPPVVSFGEDWSGRIYVVQYGATSGSVHKLTSDTGTNGPALPANPAGGCGASGGGGGAGGGGGGGGTTPAPDATPPAPGGAAPEPASDVRSPLLGSRIPPRQRLVAAGLLARLTCDEPCRISATGELSAGGRRYRLGTAVRALTPGGRASLRVRLGPRARAAARAALRRNRRANAILRIRATDAAGNASSRTARVALVS